MKTVFQWLLGFGMIAATVWSMRVPNAASFMEPELARMIFFHLPCAFTGLIFLFFGAVQSFRFLIAKAKVGGPNPMPFDIRASAANEMALILFALTMATGILFSRAQWGAWWQSDPRQTSFLLDLILVAAYFALRMAFADEQKRASASAVYSVASLLPILFLVFVFPRLPQIQKLSSHPSNTIQQGLLKGEYAQVFLLCWALILATTVWQYRMRVRASELELAMEDDDGKLDDGGYPAGARVVRPVPVSGGDAKEAGSDEKVAEG